ncbi:MAG TPA: ABC transporter substrate-binding protein [Candidatus Acidoferrales bacterium]|jgi:4,5-dihydroxyphthalate decarboxylase|nr:ABC transporter substrate-binding protein [Candidatus Acidoferrales bacterium]
MSKNLSLSFACGDYEITRPLIDGSVVPDGIDLTVLTGAGSRERHWRMARNNEYDICEFNACAYFMARDRGAKWNALPVFLHRRFRHGFVFINTSKGIANPKDLIGRRVGGTNFQPAGSIWARGILEEFYGVPYQSMTWVTERPEDIEFTPPPGLKIEMIPPDKSLDDMLAAGELDAMISPSFPKPLLRGDNRVARLFQNYKEVEVEYFRRTGIFPIMHVNVIRQEIVDQHPWVAASLVQAFDKAKQLAYQRVRNPRVVPLAWFSAAWEEQNEILGRDPWTYGLGAANRKNLATAIRYTHQQGLISRAPSVDELFLNTDDEDIREKDRI